MASATPPQQVSLGDLNTRQLTRIIMDLEETTKVMQVQFEALVTGQKRFETSLKAMEDTCNAPSSKLLVPMTPSVYQEGELVDKHKFIVDVGAGYYIERSAEKLTVYFQKRIAQIASNVKKMQALMQERKSLLEQSRLMLQKKLGEERDVQRTETAAA